MSCLSLSLSRAQEHLIIVVQARSTRGRVAHQAAIRLAPTGIRDVGKDEAAGARSAPAGAADRAGPFIAHMAIKVVLGDDSRMPRAAAAWVLAAAGRGRLLWVGVVVSAAGAAHMGD